MLVCPRCGGGSQRLRLLDGRPACGKCVRASGLIYRSQSIRTEKRHPVTAPPRLARLDSERPLPVHPRPGRAFDRRANIGFALRRSRIVARKHGVDRATDRQLRLWRSWRGASRIRCASGRRDRHPRAHSQRRQCPQCSARARRSEPPTCASWCWPIIGWRTLRSAAEFRLDDAEANLCEALHCGDPRRRDAVSMFMLRNSQRASKRGYALAASATSFEANAEPARPVHYVVSWVKPTTMEPDRELDPGEYRRDGQIFQRRRGTVLAATSAMMTALSMASFRRRLR